MTDIRLSSSHFGATSVMQDVVVLKEGRDPECRPGWLILGLLGVDSGKGQNQMCRKPKPELKGSKSRRG